MGMIPGSGRRERAFSNLTLDGSPACKLFIAPELGPVHGAHGLSPTFHSQMSTPDHPLHQIR